MPEAIDGLRKAGLKVLVLTGDKQVGSPIRSGTQEPPKVDLCVMYHICISSKAPPILHNAYSQYFTVYAGLSLCVHCRRRPSTLPTPHVWLMKRWMLSSSMPHQWYKDYLTSYEYAYMLLRRHCMPIAHAGRIIYLNSTFHILPHAFTTLILYN